MKNALLLLALLGLLSSCSSPNRSAIATSLSWTRMSPLPERADQIETAVKGNTFTREFEVSFRDSETAIKTWLNESPGTQDAEGRI